MERLVEPHEGAGCRIVEVERIGNLAGIEALAHQLHLLLLERPGDVELAQEPHEQRPRIIGQVPGEVRAERREIEARVGDQRHHAGAAVLARDGHPVDVRFLDAGIGGDGL